MRYFVRELNTVPLTMTGGFTIKFTDAGDSQGVYATTNESVASFLTDMISRHKGGVREVSKDEYDAVKKKPARKPLRFVPNLTPDQDQILAPKPKPEADPFTLDAAEANLHAEHKAPPPRPEPSKRRPQAKRLSDRE